MTSGSNQGSADWRSNTKLNYDEPTEQSSKRPCDGVREELRECLMLSECYLKEGKTLKECLRVTDGSVSDQCKVLRTTFFDCKRSLLDNRQRFRGRKGY